MSRKIDAMHERFGRHDGKCKDCGNLECRVYNKSYYKCKVYGISSSTATDWRLSWDACGMYNTLWTGRPILELIKHEGKREPILPPEGQLELDDATKDRHYVVYHDDGALGVLSGRTWFDAFDCAYCGSQNIVGVREMGEPISLVDDGEEKQEE